MPIDLKYKLPVGIPLKVESTGTAESSRRIQLVTYDIKKGLADFHFELSFFDYPCCDKLWSGLVPAFIRNHGSLEAIDAYFMLDERLKKEKNAILGIFSQVGGRIRIVYRAYITRVEEDVPVYQGFAFWESDSDVI